jgi:hypothetical protein
MDVQEKLTETFGPEYAKIVKQRATELRLDMGTLNNFAAENPTAFYAMLGLNSQPVPVNTAPPASSVNSAGITHVQSGEKGNSYYTKLRKEKPGEYFTPRIAAEEYNQLKKLGPDKFYAL